MIEAEDLPKVLLGQGRLSVAQMARLVKQRQRQIRPLLDRLAVDTLGDVYYSSPALSFTLRDYVVYLATCRGEGSLEARGIFRTTHRLDKTEDKNHLCAFGLTTDDRWIIAELVTTEERRGTLKVRRLDAPADFSVFSVDYGVMYAMMCWSVEKWMKRRRAAYLKAKAMCDRFGLETDLVANRR